MNKDNKNSGSVAVVFLCGKKAQFVFFRLCVALRNVGLASEKKFIIKCDICFTCSVSFEVVPICCVFTVFCR